MNSFANRIMMMKIGQAIKLAQEGRANEVFDSLSPQEKARIKEYIENVDPEQLNSIASKIRDVASGFSPDQIDEIKGVLENMNPALAQKLEDVLK